MSNNNGIEVIRSDVQGLAGVWDSLTADRALSFEAEAGFAMQSLMGNDYALSIAMSNRRSVINAVQNIAAIGISLNPALKEAYLVPRDGRICLDISYMGLMSLASKSGSIRWAQCAVVYERDTFELNGLDKQPAHRFNPFSKDRGPIIGAYAVVKTCDGDYLTHSMHIDDIYAIRDRSSAWKAWESKKKKCPWVTDEGEMIKKTVIKQAYKYWPRGEESGKLERAVHYLNTEAGEGIEIDQQPAKVGASAADVKLEAMSEMDILTQDRIRELANDVDLCFKMDGAALALDMVLRENLDEDQATALWGLLSSQVRAAMKTEKAARRQAASVLAEKA